MFAVDVDVDECTMEDFFFFFFCTEEETASVRFVKISSRSNAAATSLSLSFSLSNRVPRSVRSGKRLLLAAAAAVVTFRGREPLTIEGVGDLTSSFIVRDFTG